nr:immunoglobulin light chain junction region [Macaca mulatta]
CTAWDESLSGYIF